MFSTSNLHISEIATVFGKDMKNIFYTGSTLKSLVTFGTIVNKYGLNSSYCPGADANARLQNLLSNRRLSYFKGYSDFFVTTNLTHYEASNSLGSVNLNITSTGDWTATVSGEFLLTLSTYSGNGNLSNLVVSYSNNSSGFPRLGYVTFVCGGSSAYFSVRQS